MTDRVPICFQHSIIICNIVYENFGSPNGEPNSRPPAVWGGFASHYWLCDFKKP